MTRGVTGAFLASIAGVLLTVSLTAQAPWTEMRGEGFVLRGQLSADKLTSVACDLETAAKTLRRATQTNAEPRVVAVDSARGIREWLPQFGGRVRANPLGAYWRGLYGDHIVVRVDAPREERLRRILHEYAHFLTHSTHGEPPRWLDEGLSEIWEHATISKGVIEIGRPVVEHMKRLRSQKEWIPIKELLGANAVPGRNSAMFYAESWALVHYLMFEKRAGQLTIDRPFDPSELPADAALKAYVQGAMGAVARVSGAAGAGACPAVINRTEMSPLESLLSRARALADGELPDSALPLLREALRIAPAEVEAREVLGYVHFRGNRPMDAATVFDQVIATGRGSYISYYYRAVLAVPIPDQTGGGGPISAVEYLRKALALNPGFAPAVQRLREIGG